MFEKLNTPEEIFSYKLGSALSMENEILGMLEKLQQETRREELRQLSTHAKETHQHIRNIEESFQLLGDERQPLARSSRRSRRTATQR